MSAHSHEWAYVLSRLEFSSIDLSSSYSSSLTTPISTGRSSCSCFAPMRARKPVRSSLLNMTRSLAISEGARHCRTYLYGIKTRRRRRRARHHPCGGLALMRHGRPAAPLRPPVAGRPAGGPAAYARRRELVDPLVPICPETSPSRSVLRRIRPRSGDRSLSSDRLTPADRHQGRLRRRCAMDASAHP